MGYDIKYNKQAIKDIKKLKQSNLDNKAKEIIELLKNKPYDPCFEKLTGDLDGFYSRRINIKHRVIYKIDDTNKIIYIYAMWSHYDNI